MSVATYQWMFADLYLDALAKHDPLRWSDPLVFEEIKTELGKYWEALKSRPIRLKSSVKAENAELKKMVFHTLDQLQSWHRRGTTGETGERDHDADVRLHEPAAEYAMKVYEDDAKCGDESPDQWRTQEVSTTRFGIGYQDRALFLAFRGTATIFDIAKDLMCTIDNDSMFRDCGVGVHQSFWGEIRAAADTLYERIVEEALKPGRAVERLVVTGHSMGGGKAYLFHAYLWRMVQLKEWPKPEHADRPEVSRLFGAESDSRICVAFAAPSVFAPVEEEVSKSEGLCRFIMRTATNYIYREDPVPRCYAHLDLQELQKMLGRKVGKMRRCVGRASLGVAVGSGALAVAGGVASVMTGGIAPVLLVGVSSVFATGGTLGVVGATLAKEHTKWLEDYYDKKIEEVQAMQKDVKQYTDHAKKYRMCGTVRVMQDNWITWQSASDWCVFQLAVENLQHHSIAGYVRAVKERVKNGNYREAHLPLSATNGAAAIRQKVTADQLSDKAQELYDKAKRHNEWKELLRSLQVLEKGFVDKIDLGKRYWHFVHQAIKHDNVDAFTALLEVGADPLRATATRDGKPPKMSDRFASYLSYAKALKDSGDEPSSIPETLVEAIRQHPDPEHPPKLSAEEAESRKVANLVRLGFSEEQANKACTSGEGCIGGTSFEDALRRLRTSDARAEDIEEQHTFLDAAKFLDERVLREMLRAKPQLAVCGGRRLDAEKPRWTAVMQVAYMQGPLDLALELLSRYPDRDALKEARDSMQEVIEDQSHSLPRGVSRGLSRGASRPAFGGGSDGGASPETVKNLLEKALDFEGSDVCKLIEKAAKAIGSDWAPPAAAASGSAEVASGRTHGGGGGYP